MNYSFMSFSSPDSSLDELLAMAREYGYDGIEPRVSSGHGHALDFDTTADIRAAAREKSIAAGIALSCIATSCKFADPALTEQMLADAHAAIDLAGDVGAPCIRTFGGQLGEGIEREQAIDLVAGALGDIADHAGERNVTVCFETHDDWCDPAHVAAVVKQVNHKAIAVNWDIMHPVRRAGKDMTDAFNALRPWIKHVHFHDGIATADGPPEMVTIGTGAIDHATAVKLLMGDGYSGHLSGEWIRWEPAEVHLPRELAIMRDYEKENL